MTKERFLAEHEFTLYGEKYKWNGYCVVKQDSFGKWVYEASTFSGYMAEETLECFSTILGKSHSTFVRWDEMEEVIE